MVFLVFSFLIYGEISLFESVALLVIHTLFLLIRVIVSSKYMKIKDSITDNKSIKHWFIYLRVGVFTTGLTWSMLFFFIAELPPEFHFILFAVILGLAGGGLLTLGIDLYTYLSFMIPLLIIPALWMFYQDDITHITTALFLLMGVSYYILTARRSTQDFNQLIIENKKSELQKKTLHYQANHDVLQIEIAA